MKKLYLVANWKSYKTSVDAQNWFSIASNQQIPINKEEKEVVVCVPFTVLAEAKQSIVKSQLTLSLGAQDISPFAEGAYTGEVYGKQIAEFAHYVIIGHSERRQHFGDTDEVLEKKVAMSLDFGLTPIFCVQGKDTPIPQGVTIVAYEPVSAIGSGQPDSPENADGVAKAIKERGGFSVLYGGSVSPDNVHTFTTMEDIDGVLVGGASLIAEKFIQIVNNA